MAGVAKAAGCLFKEKRQMHGFVQFQQAPASTAVISELGCVQLRHNPASGEMRHTAQPTRMWNQGLAAAPQPAITANKNNQPPGAHHHTSKVALSLSRMPDVEVCELERAHIMQHAALSRLKSTQTQKQTNSGRTQPHLCRITAVLCSCLHTHTNPACPPLPADQLGRTTWVVLLSCAACHNCNVSSQQADVSRH
jgi:hypothetical protein